MLRARLVTYFSPNTYTASYGRVSKSVLPQRPRLKRPLKRLKCGEQDADIVISRDDAVSYCF